MVLSSIILPLRSLLVSVIRVSLLYVLLVLLALLVALLLPVVGPLLTGMLALMVRLILRLESSAMAFQLKFCT